MELKDTKNLHTSVETGVHRSLREMTSNNQRIYDIIFPSKEDKANPNLGKKSTHKGYEKLTFGDVSTLDWLKTWRSLEEN